MEKVCGLWVIDEIKLIREASCKKINTVNLVAFFEKIYYIFINLLQGNLNF